MWVCMTCYDFNENSKDKCDTCGKAKPSATGNTPSKLKLFATKQPTTAHAPVKVFPSFAAKAGSTTSLSRISVLQGDLVKEKVDVLVNTTGTEAKLIHGSVSYAFLEAGGHVLQSEITKHYPHGLKVGEVAQTNGGELRCKKVFHVVLETWKNVGDESEEVLQEVVTECLDWAEKQGFTSIAFPALGAGFHRFPARRAAEIMFDAVEKFFDNKKQSTLKCVQIVVHPRDLYNFQEFSAVQKGINYEHSNYHSKSVVLKTNYTDKEIELRIVIGCLSREEAQVLVNTTQTNLALSVGAVSRSLVKKGGGVLQEECRKQHPGGIDQGQMVQTSGGNLACRKVFHVVLQTWDKGKGSSKKIFQDIMKKCLQAASDQGFTSICFPVLGTGYLEFPPSTSGKYMHEAIKEFLEEHHNTNLQTVTVVIAHKDAVIRKFVEESLEGQDEQLGITSTLTPALTTISDVAAAIENDELKYIPIQPGCYTPGSQEEKEFNFVATTFFNSLAQDDNNRHIFEITEIEIVVNPTLLKHYCSAKIEMEKKDKSYGQPSLGFHGTSKENVRSICSGGFRLPDHEEFVKTTDVGWYGNGIYLSPSARFAMNYMKKSKMLILCQALQGKIFKCEKLKLGDPKQPGFDSHADPYGKEMVLYDDHCILPRYIIHFKIRDRVKKKGDEYDPNENDETELQFLGEMELHKGEKLPGL